MVDWRTDEISEKDPTEDAAAGPGLADLNNELASVVRRLPAQIAQVVEIERARRDLAAIRCTSPLHAQLIEASIRLAASARQGRPAHTKLEALAQLVDALNADRIFDGVETDEAAGPCGNSNDAL